MASATATKRRPKKTAKNDGVNKAEEIRKAAKEIGGKKVRPKQVIELLAKRDIIVSSPQVSATLKAAGYKRTRRGRKKTAAHSAASHESAGLSIKDLLAAKALIHKVGSAETAKKAIDLLAKLY